MPNNPLGTMRGQTASAFAHQILPTDASKTLDATASDATATKPRHDSRQSPPANARTNDATRARTLDATASDAKASNRSEHPEHFDALASKHRNADASSEYDRRGVAIRPIDADRVDELHVFARKRHIRLGVGRRLGFGQFARAGLLALTDLIEEDPQKLERLIYASRDDE